MRKVLIQFAITTQQGRDRSGVIFEKVEMDQATADAMIRDVANGGHYLNQWIERNMFHLIQPVLPSSSDPWQVVGGSIALV